MQRILTFCQFNRLEGKIHIQFCNKSIHLHITYKLISLQEYILHFNALWRSFTFLFKTLLHSLSQEFQQILQQHLYLFQASNLHKSQQQPQELSWLQFLFILHYLIVIILQANCIGTTLILVCKRTNLDKDKHLEKNVC